MSCCWWYPLLLLVNEQVISDALILSDMSEIQQQILFFWPLRNSDTVPPKLCKFLDLAIEVNQCWHSPRPPTPLSRLRSHSPWLMDGQYGLHAWRQAPETPTAQWSTSRAVVTQFRPPRFNHDFRWCLWSLHNLPMTACISSHTQHSCHLVGWLAIVNCPECFESGRIWWVWSWWACEENEMGLG